MLAVLAAVGMLLVLSARCRCWSRSSGGWARPDPNHRRRIPPGGEPNGSGGHLIGTAAAMAFFVPAVIASVA
jgi:hypothetical protein